MIKTNNKINQDRIKMKMSLIAQKTSMKKIKIIVKTKIIKIFLIHLRIKDNIHPLLKNQKLLKTNL